jgi:predicted O-methyltransferase YrrM
MIEKLKTLGWFSFRPSFWSHALALVARKFKTNHDLPENRVAATAWASSRARPLLEILLDLRLLTTLDTQLPAMSQEDIDIGAVRARRTGVKMGGAGDLELLYATVFLTQATRVLETGVAYGWSSLAIRTAQHHAGVENAVLVSVDMPYVKLGAEQAVGVVVPDRYREGWTLIREPDRNGIKKALQKLGGMVDLVHYDSDKSWYGRAFAYPILWHALRPGGVFISDDIQDNLFFCEFAKRLALPVFVAESQGKFVGVIRKPS